MKVPILKYFCCGCTLRTGCLVVGWVCSAEALIPLVYLQTWSAYYQAGELAIVRSSREQEEAATHGVVQGFLVLYAILTTVKFIVSLCLIYGTSRSKRPFLLSWLYCCTTIWTINILAYLAVAIIYLTTVHAMIGIGVLLATGANCAWAVYALIVVNSHYLKLKEDSTVVH